MRNQKTKDPDSHISVDWQELKRLLEFMEEHGLEEFEYSRGDFRVRLRKPGSGVVWHPAAIPGRPEGEWRGLRETGGRGGGATDDETAGGTAGAETSGSAAGEEQANGAHVVKSPIVGTYYEAPNPGAPPFIKLGDHVSAGQVICIVEAMKLMNEIESDASGKVTKIFMQNGQPVEYGQPLFVIQPANQA
jgi:acetyl-CoA carboxylase biotin carboxyl carrier protein